MTPQEIRETGIKASVAVLDFHLALVNAFERNADRKRLKRRAIERQRATLLARRVNI